MDGLEASRRVESRGLKPAGPYPGAGSQKWQLVCKLCNSLTLESLVQIEKRRRPGCKICCSKSQNRLTDAQAEKRLSDKKLTPLEPYPGQLREKWKVSCDLCGSEHTTSLERLSRRANPGCANCGLKEAKSSITVESFGAEERLEKLNLRPLEKYPGHTKLPWKVSCRECRSEFSKSLNQMESRIGCSNCKETRKRNEFSEAAVAELRAFGFKPLEPYPGPGRPWKAKCLVCNEASGPRLNTLRYAKAGCRHCAIQKKRQLVISESFSRAIEQMRASGFEPIEDFKGFTKPWRAVCQRCQKVSSPAPKWLSQGHGCKHCASNAPWSKEKANSVAKAAKRRFLEDFQDATSPIKMECLRCGAIRSAKPSSLLNAKGFCNECKPAAAWTEAKARQVMRAANLEPLEPFINATTKWRSICNTCGTEGAPMLTNIASGQGGCKVCGNFGFDINKPTTLYVLYNRELGVVKVGITNTGSTRLRTLSSVGFKPGKLYEFKEGSEPLEIETLLLRYLRKTLGFSQAMTRQQMKSAGGATETFWVDQARPHLIHARIRALLKAR